MTQRRRLDAFLAEQAAAAGATSATARGRGRRLGPDGATATVGGERVAAAVVVGADGANGVVAKAAGSSRDRPRRRARGQRRLGLSTANAIAGSAVVELGFPGGYGWVFPKGDHANLGVGGWAAEGPHLRDHLAVLARAPRRRSRRAHRSPRAPAADAPRGRRPGARERRARWGRGWARRPALGRRHLRGVRRPRARGGRDPGRRPRPATRELLAKALDHHASASWAAKSALDRHPGVCFWAARSPRVFGVVAGLLRGDVRHPNEARGLARPPLG